MLQAGSATAEGMAIVRGMGDGNPSRRIVPAAAGLALLGFGIWHSWAEFQARRLQAFRDARQTIAAAAMIRYAPPIDSVCHRIGGDSLVPRDGLRWTANRTGLPLRAQGREDGWDWGCLQTPDSGIVLFVALDSGCATGGSGGLWNHSCRLVTQAWDLEAAQGPSAQFVTSARSLWSDPGTSRICPSSNRPDPPVDSVVQERCGSPSPEH